MADAKKFPETRWSVVLKAGEPEGARARSDLCEAYRKPVYEFLRQLGCSHDAADDMAQGFFADLIKRDDLSRLKPGRGLFRCWLRKALKNYLSKERAKARAQKRGGNQPIEVFDDGGRATLDLSARQPLGTDALVDRIWDQWWAHSVIENALVRLQTHRACRGRLVLVEELCRASIGMDFEKNDPEIAQQLKIDVKSVRVYRLRVRRAFVECVDAEIARTVEDDVDLASEHQRLLRAFSAADVVLPRHSEPPRVQWPAATPGAEASEPGVHP